MRCWSPSPLCTLSAITIIQNGIQILTVRYFLSSLYVSAFRDERRIALQSIQLDCGVGCLLFDLSNLGSVEVMLGYKLVKLGGVLGQVHELRQMMDLVTLGFQR